ncbi:MAG: hypothetical protein EXQ81_07850 [Thermoleophilia bacterium]|nr:hypothetical protein [Thermoleophilia bacterium]
MKNRPHHLRRRLILASGVLVVAGLVAGGIAYATIPELPYGNINGCFKNSNGALRVIDLSAGGACSGTEGPLSWSRGYAQDVRRAEVFFSEVDGVTYEPLVGSALLGGRNWRGGYAVTAKTVIHPNTSVLSECKLEAWRDGDTPPFRRYVVDESRQGPSSFATHMLQGVVTGPISVQLLCRAGDSWKAEHSTIIGTQVGQWAQVAATNADPATP